MISSSSCAVFELHVFVPVLVIGLHVIDNNTAKLLEREGGRNTYWVRLVHCLVD